VTLSQGKGEKERCSGSYPERNGEEEEMDGFQIPYHFLTDAGVNLRQRKKLKDC
jgi:hypothetical protein